MMRKSSGTSPIMDICIPANSLMIPPKSHNEDEEQYSDLLNGQESGTQAMESFDLFSLNIFQCIFGVGSCSKEHVKRNDNEF